LRLLRKKALTTSANAVGASVVVGTGKAVGTDNDVSVVNSDVTLDSFFCVMTAYAEG
jgi:hypothetical protein